jgi:hypothetical protein
VEWGGFDIRHPPGRELIKRMANPRTHQQFEFAGGPLILTSQKWQLEKECEFWKRTAGRDLLEQSTIPLRGFEIHP